MFWFKKIISQLFMPVSLTVLLLVLAFVLFRYRQLSRILLSFALALLVFMSSSVGSNFLLMHLESRFPVNNQTFPSACLVMVLGSGDTQDPKLTAVQQLSSTALSRLMEGMRQMRLGGSQCQLVVSGWSGGLSERSHAELMADAAVELGVPRQLITLFPLAKDTIEEAAFMKQYFGQRYFRLVTSASHMPRAMTIFNHAQLNVSAAPTDFAYRNTYWWRLDAQNLLSSQRAIHEYLGLLWLKIKYELLTESSKESV